MAKEPAQIISAQSIPNEFETLQDPRSNANRVHQLGDMIVISIMIAGADGPKAIGTWARSNQTWLQDRLELPGGIPSHDTTGRVLMALKPAAFQKCFEQWIASLLAKHPELDWDILAVDGKALRRSHDAKSSPGPQLLVSAWAVRRGVGLGQLATAEKSNEITAIPKLLPILIWKAPSSRLMPQGARSRLLKRSLLAKATTSWRSKETKATCMKR